MDNRKKLAAHLSATDQKKLKVYAVAIRKEAKRTIAGAVKIGKWLAACKDLAGHGHWGSWLEREFGLSESAALRFMQVADMVKSKSVKLTDLARLPLAATYQLAKPSTPQSARDAIIADAVKGKQITVAVVRETIQQRTFAPHYLQEPQPQEPRQITVVAKLAPGQPAPPERGRIMSTDDLVAVHTSELGRWLTESARAIPRRWSRGHDEDDDPDLAAAVAKLTPDQQTTMAKIINFVERLAAVRRKPN
jgi:hypothetical protein